MNRLKDLREDRELRQTDVAHVVGVDQRTLSNYETGKTIPDAEMVIALADFFGVSADYLLGRDLVDTQTLLRRIQKIETELDKLKRDIHRL